MQHGLPIFPTHCGVKENLAVWSLNRWQYFNVDYLEALPAASVSIVNSGAVAANTTDDLFELTAFDVDEHQLLQLRFMPLDDIEIQLWETRSQGKFATRGIHARASLMEVGLDPSMARTEFNILGRDRNAFIASINNGDYNYAQSRSLFWGWKYILVPLRSIVEHVDATGVLRAYVSAEGRETPLITSRCVAEGRLA